jgi:hypothetical protein
MIIGDEGKGNAGVKAKNTLLKNNEKMKGLPNT